MKNFFEQTLQLKFKLSEQAKLTIVSLFQKALLTMEDVSSILEKLEIKLENDQVYFTNPELCHLSEEDIQKMSQQLEASVN